MGQEASCLSKNHLSPQIIKEPEELQARRKIHPLHYVKPVDFNFDEP